MKTIIAGVKLQGYLSLRYAVFVWHQRTILPFPSVLFRSFAAPNRFS
jgi:hypothetical protein